MVLLRPTAKLHHFLPPADEPAQSSDTALGDWYAGPLKVDHQPLLLLVSARSLLTILTPARQVATIPRRLPTLVAARLRRLGAAADLIEAEVGAMSPVQLARTRDRSVLGSLVDFAKAIPFYLPIRAWDETTLPFLELRLAQTPCRCGDRSTKTIFPEDETVSLLQERWAPMRAG